MPIDQKEKVHFLHIGKTGGSAIKHALQPALNDGKYEIILHNHEFTLKATPVGEKVFFFVCNPLERFVRGFYSRKRQGKPKYNFPWNKGEEMAFSYFETPNSLAKTLSSHNPIKKRRVLRAMKNIGHVNSLYWDWFGDEEHLLSRLPDILFVRKQENLTSDLEELKEILNIPNAIIPKDAVNMHKNPRGLDVSLYEVSENN